MRDFPSCFGENGVQVGDSSSSSAARNAQNLVACSYRCRLKGRCCLITLTWSKHMMGQSLSVGIDDSSNQCLCKVDAKPWLFSKRKGCKSLEAYSSKVNLHWDLSSVKFGSGPEPLEGFYVAVVVDRHVILLLGDLRKEALKKTNATLSPWSATFVGKREHIFGKKVFATKAQFYDKGQVHAVVIECDTAGLNDPCLLLRIDNKTVMQIKRLRWKFRGNHTIIVDGLAVEVLWDVHDWLFTSPCGNAVFMFNTCFSANKLWSNQSSAEPNSLPWSFSQRRERLLESKCQGAGFSLIFACVEERVGAVLSGKLCKDFSYPTVI